jgi:hypothetical protein
MRTRRRATTEELRLAIDALPHATRVAMLEGVRANEIIVGAYSTADGICPMLAAHRRGGRTPLIAFARAWDGYAFRGSRDCTARPATKRELLVLTSHLEASLLADSVGPYDEYDRALALLTAEQTPLTAQQTWTRPPSDRHPAPEPEPAHLIP